jgi:ParB family chromosome partitioning protein
MALPWMTEEELTALADDIKTNGLLQPITLFEGKILDGKCRYQACIMAGVQPTFEQYGYLCPSPRKGKN